MRRFNFIIYIELFCNYERKFNFVIYKFSIVVLFGYNFIYYKIMITLSLVILTFLNFAFLCFLLLYVFIKYKQEMDAFN